MMNLIQHDQVSELREDLENLCLPSATKEYEMWEEAMACVENAAVVGGFTPSMSHDLRGKLIRLHTHVSTRAARNTEDEALWTKVFKTTERLGRVELSQDGGTCGVEREEEPKSAMNASFFDPPTEQTKLKTVEYAEPPPGPAASLNWVPAVATAAVAMPMLFAVLA